MADWHGAGVSVMDAGINIERYALSGREVEERGAMAVGCGRRGPRYAAAALLNHLGVNVLAHAAFFMSDM